MTKNYDHCTFGVKKEENLIKTNGYVKEEGLWWGYTNNEITGDTDKENNEYSVLCRGEAINATNHGIHNCWE